MNKFISVAVASILFLGAGTASAQSYSYDQSFGCVNISRELSLGARGSDVTNLQRFLLGRNYPGSGSWMVTGYFGRATEAAVRNFQQEQRLLPTGRIDSQTRMALDRVSCQGSQGGAFSISPPYAYTNPSIYNSNPFNTSYPQPYFNNNSYLPTGQIGNYPYPFGNFYLNPTITSLSANSGNPGTSVTIYGTGFDVSNNVVYFGTTAVYAYTQNGTTLTMNVPSNVAGTVQVYVQNSRGTSNNIPFTITTNYNNYNTYNNGYNGYQYGCLSGQGNNYGSVGSCCGFGQICPLSISYINPTSGGAGTSVTIVGSGFSTTGNTVHFGVGIITGLTSPDGRSVSFTVPTQLSGYGSQIVTLGQYPVSVSNASGQTSNTLTYTVTSIGPTAAPIISSVSGPTTLSVNSSGVWTLTLNNQNSTFTTASVSWGDPVYGTYMAAPQQIYGNGTQTITFSHTYSQTGTFTILFTVTNQNGQSNTSSVTVNVTNGSQAGNVVLSSISPMSGHVGTQVVLTGSNFSTLDNTIHFGQGGTLHVPSINGNTIYFTIPYATSPCDLIGYGCSAPTTLVSAGQYPVYVSNSSGTSGTLFFTVQ